MMAYGWNAATAEGTRSLFIHLKDGMAKEI
jgi:hypothetical protein